MYWPSHWSRRWACAAGTDQGGTGSLEERVETVAVHKADVTLLVQPEVEETEGGE